MNLATLVDEQAQGYGDRVLAIFDDDTVTYAQSAERAGRVGAGLKDLGVNQGDRVAIMMGNRSEFLYAWFGILKLGAVEVPIHDAARGPGISHILNTTEARVLIVEDVFRRAPLPRVVGADARRCSPPPCFDPVHRRHDGTAQGRRPPAQPQHQPRHQHSGGGRVQRR
jgi:acyl-CoA synthetase (AMP-forming)/AMP-acid ligase II